MKTDIIKFLCMIEEKEDTCTDLINFAHQIIALKNLCLIVAAKEYKGTDRNILWQIVRSVRARSFAMLPNKVKNRFTIEALIKEIERKEPK